MSRIPTKSELEGRMFIGFAVIIVLVGYFIVHSLAVYDLNKDVAQRAVEEYGLTNVEVSGAWLNVMNDDCAGHLAHRNASGLNADGIRVKGVVCGGAMTTAEFVVP